MAKLPQMLRIVDEMGEFEPKGPFLGMDVVDQIDVLNDWAYDIEQYRRHLMVSLALQMGAGDTTLTWARKIAAFRQAATVLGLVVPDDFEEFFEAHRNCHSIPIKPGSCPACNRQDN